MEAHGIELYNDILKKVLVFYKGLRLDKLVKNGNKAGRKLAMPVPDILALSIFKQEAGIMTKKSVYLIFQPDCSYKTMVVNMNRFIYFAMLILACMLKSNQRKQHRIKHTDSTDIPVCLNKNAKHHKTMGGLASWGHTGKGFFYGLKLHLTDDLFGRILAVLFASANASDVSVFKKVNEDLTGIFIVDRAYISQKLAEEFYHEKNSFVFAKPRKNMKKIATIFQNLLYDTRMQIEVNFRNLKCFHGLVTSLPRSVNGYLANYIYSLTAYLFRQNPSLKDRYLLS